MQNLTHVLVIMTLYAIARTLLQNPVVNDTSQWLPNKDMKPERGRESKDGLMMTNNFPNRELGTQVERE